jgi:hypothetical protein
MLPKVIGAVIRKSVTLSRHNYEWNQNVIKNPYHFLFEHNCDIFGLQENLPNT